MISMNPMARNEMKGELSEFVADINRRWNGFLLPLADLWTRVDGQRLIFTRSGFASKEDMTGRLLTAFNDWYILGRDEQRVYRTQVLLAKEASLELARLMEYDRADVLGRARKFESKSIPAKQAQIQVFSGERGVCAYVMPPVFVTYVGKTGRRMYRQLETEYVSGNTSVPRADHSAGEREDLAGKP